MGIDGKKGGNGGGLPGAAGVVLLFALVVVPPADGTLCCVPASGTLYRNRFLRRKQRVLVSMLYTFNALYI